MFYNAVFLNFCLDEFLGKWKQGELEFTCTKISDTKVSCGGIDITVDGLIATYDGGPKGDTKGDETGTLDKGTVGNDTITWTTSDNKPGSLDWIKGK